MSNRQYGYAWHAGQKAERNLSLEREKEAYNGGYKKRQEEEIQILAAAFVTLLVFETINFTYGYFKARNQYIKEQKETLKR